MKYIDINDAKENLILAEDVFDNQGLLLAKNNTELTRDVINKMKKADVAIIAIIPQDGEEEEEKELLSEEEKDRIMNMIIQSISKYSLLGKDYFSSIRGIALEAASDLMLQDECIYILSEISKIDEYTINHSLRVSLLSALIASWEELDKKDIKKAYVAGLFSQVGKLGVPKELLLKTTPLTDEELLIVKSYTANSEQYLQRIPCINEEVKLAVLQSTEKLNGSGFPQGLKSPEICQLAQIIAVANIFDAAINKKCYKEAISPFKIAKELFDASIERLSPKATVPLIKTIQSTFIGMKVELSNGEVGEVVFMNKLDPSRPLVKVGDKIYDLSMGKEHITITKMMNR